MASSYVILPTLNEIEIFGLWLLGDLIFTIVFSLCFRHRTDRNQDGIIQVSEVPYIIRTDQQPVVISQPHLFDLSLLSFSRTLWEAFLHSFCYGSTVVFAMNWMLEGYYQNGGALIDDRFAYLITISMIFMANMFMCMYATNGIHIVTSHMIHFIYYGFGYIPLVFYEWGPTGTTEIATNVTLPGGVLIAAYSLLRLLTFYVGRNYALPNYPGPNRLLRMYKYNDTATKTWDFVSAPKCLLGHPDDEACRDSNVPPDAWGLSDANTKDELDIPALNEMNKWALTFLTFEILNTHFSSNYTIGVTVGSLASWIIAVSGIDSLVSDISLYVAVGSSVVISLLIQIFGLFYGSIENQLHNNLVLTRFWPKTTAMILSACGGASVILNLEKFDDKKTNASDIVTYVSRGAFVAGVVLTYVFAFVAHFAQDLYKPISSSSGVNHGIVDDKKSSSNTNNTESDKLVVADDEQGEVQEQQQPQQQQQQQQQQDPEASGTFEDPETETFDDEEQQQQQQQQDSDEEKATTSEVAVTPS